MLPALVKAGAARTRNRAAHRLAGARQAAWHPHGTAGARFLPAAVAVAPLPLTMAELQPQTHQTPVLHLPGRLVVAPRAHPLQAPGSWEGPFSPPSCTDTS